MKQHKISSVSVLTFSFLFSGNILHGLYYSSGNPVICYICSSAFLLVFSYFASKWFSKRKSISEKAYSKFFAVLAGLALLVSLSFTVSVYALSLGTFADYYATGFVVVFSVIAVAFSGLCAGKKGERAVSGLAQMTLFVMIAWILAGFMGFVHTKTFVPLKSPFDNIAHTDFAEIIKNTVIISFDTVLLLVIFNGNKSISSKKQLRSQMLSGVLAYVGASGINMLKNIFMFGVGFLERLYNPDLAAIRLVPMFELPEISVIVNTFAVAIRASVYLCALIYIIKEAFGEKAQDKKTSFAILSTLTAFTLAFIYVIKDTALSQYICIISLVFVLLFATAFFSEREKR